MSTANIPFDDDPQDMAEDFFLYNEATKEDEDEEDEDDILFDQPDPDEVLNEFSSKASDLADRLKDAGSNLSDLEEEVSQLLSDVQDAASDLDDDLTFDELISAVEAIDDWFSSDGDMCSSELADLADDLDLASL
jgi:predicted nuclease with TOPRIM domain